MPNSQSIHISKFYHILFYHPKKLIYQLYHTILQYSQYLNFYFTIQHNKIIYLKTQNPVRERGIDKVNKILVLKKKQCYSAILALLQIFLQQLVFASPDAGLVWCINDKILLHIAFAIPNANALRKWKTGTFVQLIQGQIIANISFL